MFGVLRLVYTVVKRTDVVMNGSKALVISGFRVMGKEESKELSLGLGKSILDGLVNVFCCKGELFVERRSVMLVKLVGGVVNSSVAVEECLLLANCGDFFEVV